MGNLAFLLGDLRQRASVVGAIPLVSEPLLDLLPCDPPLYCNQLHGDRVWIRMTDVLLIPVLHDQYGFLGEAGSLFADWSDGSARLIPGVFQQADALLHSVHHLV